MVKLEKTMKTEKAVISFVAVLAGILAAGVVFYFYQATKTIPPSKAKPVSLAQPTPMPTPSVFLSIESPRDEEVKDTKTITINGKTNSDAVVTISTESENQVITPAKNGNFSATITLDNGQNQIEITAIAPNGEETTLVRTVTFSTESF